MTLTGEIAVIADIYEGELCGLNTIRILYPPDESAVIV